MSSTDVKILANACITPVVTNTMHLVGGEQKCVKRRAMISRVIRAEGWGLAQTYGTLLIPLSS
eukprot:2883424-Pyramimonas_sp.AAC.1